jgi:hypothetical protein
LFDFLTSSKRPASGTPVLPATQVIERLNALNRPTAPWGVIDGHSEAVDLVAEWKIVHPLVQDFRQGGSGQGFQNLSETG